MDTNTDTSATVADAAFFSSLKEETHFYIVRHGQSEGNAKGLFQGRLDLPLEKAGREQARTAGAWLAAQGVRVVVSSPLARAAQTAGIVAEACGIEPSFDGLFREIDTGIFTGLGYKECRERYPDVFEDFEGRSWEAVPGAERAEALYGRAMRSWTLLSERAKSGCAKIACVSHGGFIQWLVRSTFGCRSWMPLLSTANCGIFELLVEPTRSGSPYLQWRYINYQAPAAASSSPGAPPATSPAWPIPSLPSMKADHSGSD
jgi:broad specificity phosphatase PhoE